MNENDPIKSMALQPEQIAELTAALRAASAGTESNGTPSSEEALNAASWEKAKQTVEAFKPVPWFIWRIANLAFGSHRKPQQIPEGTLLGLKRIVLAAATDALLTKAPQGAPKRVLRPGKLGDAISALESSVIAAVCIVHALSRKISSRPNERLWRPVLDDALIQAKIGLLVGGFEPEFGAGRGMLAGFALRYGEALFLASATPEQGSRFLELVATGVSLGDAGVQVLGMNPLHLGALTLAAGGVGTETAPAFESFARGVGYDPNAAASVQRWTAALQAIAGVRNGKTDQLPLECLEILSISDEQIALIIKEAKNTIRRGHGWGWITQGAK